MRLLPVGTDHVGNGAAFAQSASDGLRYRRCDVRQHLPVRTYLRIRDAIKHASQGQEG